MMMSYNWWFVLKQDRATWGIMIGWHSTRHFSWNSLNTWQNTIDEIDNADYGLQVVCFVLISEILCFHSFCRHCLANDFSHSMTTFFFYKWMWNVQPRVFASYFSMVHRWMDSTSFSWKMLVWQQIYPSLSGFKIVSTATWNFSSVFMGFM